MLAQEAREADSRIRAGTLGSGASFGFSPTFHTHSLRPFVPPSNILFHAPACLLMFLVWEISQELTPSTSDVSWSFQQTCDGTSPCHFWSKGWSGPRITLLAATSHFCPTWVCFQLKSTGSPPPHTQFCQCTAAKGGSQCRAWTGGWAALVLIPLRSCVPLSCGLTSLCFSSLLCKVASSYCLLAHWVVKIELIDTCRHLAQSLACINKCHCCYARTVAADLRSVMKILNCGFTLHIHSTRANSILCTSILLCD